ncbi:MAG: hypothetical protein UY48_C0030G0003 [Candidatus Gottesmanbacteria bacterium GW2011_GWB1_49_7]|uniref:Uncharacterized protein n=1 Tax=Candidatus Gottesmanbacteria bacterium GW2011_GWB1_49_7 TaxID=1618448 RepID=A0A0G1VWF1_9BACT|nr:MAG: hypothetical protein UY48_C0030G0003 [Candidatus Gottesmanbacteria bacterium GW2011_GWB1_49_7]
MATVHNPTRINTLVVDQLVIPYTSSAALTKRLFNQLNTTSGKAELASVNGEGIVGVLLDDVAGANQEALEIVEGKATLAFDATLDEQNLAKVGSAGRATLWKDSQTTIQASIAGEATAVTQPAAASVLTIAQAADVAADRGRIVVVVGSNAGGVGIMEEITLNATNSSTSVDGATSFTKVAGAYMKNGAVLGAQSVTISDDDPAVLMTIANATSELAADIPSGTLEAYCNIIDLVGPNADATFISLVGYKAATPTTLTAERLTLDAASPSAAVSAAAYRQVTRICLGEFTNAATATVKTDADVDPPERIQGRVITPAVYLGEGAIQLV